MPTWGHIPGRVSRVGLSARLLVLIVVAVLPSVGLCVFFAERRRESETLAAMQEAMRLTRLAALTEEHLISGARQLLVALARVPQVRSGTARQCEPFLTAVNAEFPQYIDISAFGLDGAAFCSSRDFRAGSNAAALDFFRRAVDTRGFVIGEQIASPVSGRPTITFSYPVVDDAQAVRAVLTADLDLDWLAQQGPRVALLPGASFVVIDSRGTILTRHPDPATWVGRRLPDAPLARKILASAEEGTAHTTGFDGVPRLFAFTRVGSDTHGPALHVAVGIPRATVDREVRAGLARNLSIVGLTALLTVAIAWAAADRLVLRPVRRLIVTTGRLARGDLRARSESPGAVGELRTLADAYDAMAVSLEKARDELAGSLERFELFADRVKGHALFMLDLEGRIATWNAGAERLFRYRHADVVGSDFARLCTEAAVALGLPDDIADSARRDGDVRLDFLARRGDGTDFWAHLHVTSLSDASGGPRGFACLVHDQTEEKRAEQARRALARRLLTVQEEERGRVARELHDEIGQLLTALKLTLQSLPQLPADQMESRIQAGLAAVDRAIAQVRSLSLELRPLVLDDLGLAAAVRWHVDRRSSEAGLTPHLKLGRDQGRLPAEIETTAYRVVQEALTNIQRHAHARNVWIDIDRAEGSLVVSVRDDGVGFDPQAARAARQTPFVGLSGMRERVILAGGEFELVSRPGEGTEVRAILPLSGVPDMALETTGTAR